MTAIEVTKNRSPLNYRVLSGSRAILAYVAVLTVSFIINNFSFWNYIQRIISMISGVSTSEGVRVLANVKGFVRKQARSSIAFLSTGCHDCCETPAIILETVREYLLAVETSVRLVGASIYCTACRTIIFFCLCLVPVALCQVLAHALVVVS